MELIPFENVEIFTDFHSSFPWLMIVAEGWFVVFIGLLFEFCVKMFICLVASNSSNKRCS